MELLKTWRSQGAHYVAEFLRGEKMNFIVIHSRSYKVPIVIENGNFHKNWRFFRDLPKYAYNKIIKLHGEVFNEKASVPEPYYSKFPYNKRSVRRAKSPFPL